MDASAVADGRDGRIERDEVAYRARVLEALPQLLVVLDEHGTIAFAGGQPMRGVPLDLEALVGRHAAELVHPDDVDAVLSVLPDRGVHVGDVVGPMAFRIFDDEGGVRVVEGLATDRLDDPGIRGLVVTLRDIVGPHMLERAFAELAAGNDLETIAASVVESLAEPPLDSVGLVVESGGRPDAKVVAVSPTLADDPLLGEGVATATELYREHEGPERFDADLARVPDGVASALRQAGVLSTMVQPVHVRHQARPPLHLVVGFPWVLPPTMNQTRLVERDARVLTMAFERIDLEAKLVHAAEHDPLTGLPNRSALVGWVDDARRERGRRRDETTAALLYVDLDGFKAVNDRLGHPAGDEALVTIAHRLIAAVREGDRVVRLGGDEFAVVLRGADEAQALELSRRLVAVVCEPLQLDAGTATVGASIGVALGAPWELDDLLERADDAMYHAKRHDDLEVHVAAAG